MARFRLTVALIVIVAGIPTTSLLAQADTSQPQWRRVRAVGERPVLLPPSSAIAIPAERLARARSSIQPIRPNRPNPRRNFGPFHTGSHIDAIKILASGTTAPSWYFTDYLTQHPTTKIRRYFPSGFTPLTTLPSGVRHVPGTVGQSDGLHDFQLSLQRWHYSGRYGGSIELTFGADETYEYDARLGSTVWDFTDLTLRAYIVPSAARFNTNPGMVGNEPIFVEFEPSVRATYHLNANGTVAGLDTANRSAALDTVWAAFRTQVGAGSGQGQAFRRAAAAFVYGFMHDSTLFGDRLTGTNLVSELLLDEGFVDPIVNTGPQYAGTPYIYAAFRMSALDDPDVGNDLEARVGGCLVDASSQDSYCGDHRYVLNGRTSTTYSVMAIMPLSDCNTHTFLNFVVDIDDVDLVFDDEFSTGVQYRLVDCQVLQAMASQQRWGDYEIVRAENVPLRDGDGDARGLVSVEIRLSVENR